MLAPPLPMMAPASCPRTVPSVAGKRRHQSLTLLQIRKRMSSSESGSTLTRFCGGSGSPNPGSGCCGGASLASSRKEPFSPACKRF